MMLLVLLALTQTPTTPTTTTVSAHGHGHGFHGFFVGDTIEFEAHVSSSTGGRGFPRPTGTVTFDITDSNLVTTTLGPVSLTGHWRSEAEAFISTLTAGTYLVVATYSGDANFASSSNSATPFSITISPAATHTHLSPHWTYVVQNGTVTFTVHVSTGWGFSWRGQTTPVVGALVNWSAPGGTPTSGTTLPTDANGNATFTVTFPTLGTTPVTATYAGDANHGASSSTANVNVVTTLPPWSSPWSSPTSFWSSRNSQPSFWWHH
jgi:hypothetical protein